MNAEKEKQVINGYCDAVGDLLSSAVVQQMRQYPHHKTVSTFWHSVYVSYLTYRFCGGLHLQQREAARAALLHDFYLYNWYVENMILSHMWPLFVEPPKSKEAYVLTLADKIAATRDLLGLADTFQPMYAQIERELIRRGAFENRR